MSLSDKVYVNLDLLPITEEEKEKLPSDAEFQTKDLECYMHEVYISERGRLEIVRLKSTDEEIDEGIDADNKRLPVRYKKVPLPKEDLNFHGILNFGGFDFEFFAKFTDGNLVEITRDDTPYFHVVAPHIYDRWE